MALSERRLAEICALWQDHPYDEEALAFDECDEEARRLLGLARQAIDDLLAERDRLAAEVEQLRCHIQQALNAERESDALHQRIAALQAEIETWEALHEAQRASSRVGEIVQGLLGGSVLGDGAWWRELKIEYVPGSEQYPWRVRFGRRRKGFPRLSGWWRAGFSLQEALERLLDRAIQEG